MPSKMFLKLDGVPGASTSPRHFGEIEITGWAFGTSQPKIAHDDAVKGNLEKNLRSDLNVTKAPDKTSQTLLNTCITGRVFSHAVMTIENVSEAGNLIRSVVFKLKTAVITSVTSGGGSLETITFNYEKAEIVHQAKAMSAE